MLPASVAVLLFPPKLEMKSVISVVFRELSRCIPVQKNTDIN